MFLFSPPPLTFTSLTADHTAPQPPNTTITFTAAGTGGTPPYQARWWLWDGATWTMVRDWGALTFAWMPLTPNANYRVGVWLRSAGNSTNTPEAFGSIPFAIQ